MQHFVEQLRNALQGMGRFRWYALILTWLMAVLGWGFVYSLPNMYETRARVYVDVQTALKPLLKGITVQTDVISEVNLLTEALLSRPNLEKMVNDTDMRLRVDSPLEMRNLLDTLQKKVTIEVGNKVNLYDISYQDIDPRMANAVVQTLLNNLIDETLGKQRTDTVNAQDFLVQQVKDYAARLNESEHRLSEFKKKNLGQMPADNQDYYAKLQLAIRQHNDTLSALNLAKSRLEDLQKQIQGETPVFGLRAETDPRPVVTDTDAGQDSSSVSADLGTPATSYDSALIQAKDQLDQLSARYTEKYPDVVETKKRVAQLEVRQKQEQTEIIRSRPKRTVKPKVAKKQAPEIRDLPLEENPVYQNMKIGMDDAQTQMGLLTARSEQEQAEIEGIKLNLSNIPTVEADLAQLNRDYDVTKAQYETLAERLDTARLSDDAAKNNEIKFRVIEPPAVALKPVGPNRPLFLSIVFFAALLTGLAMAFLLHKIRPVFITSRDLRMLTGLPVFGTITLKRQPSQVLRLRANSLILIIASLMLLPVFAGVVHFNQSGSQFARSIFTSDSLKKLSILKGSLN